MNLSTFVDPVDYKILKRVCNQYKTGIRKHFSVNGRILLLDNLYLSTNVLLRFVDVRDRYDCEVLEDVTPEAILTAINMFDVRDVMES